MARDDDYGYQPRSYEDAKKQRDSRGGMFDSYIRKDYKLYKVKDGKNLIRIMPPTWKGHKHYGFKIFVNYGIGPDNNSYLSLSRMKGEADPLDEARREADRAGDEEAAKKLNPTERVLLWVIDRDNEDDGPMIWACPRTADSDILGISTDDDTKEVVPIDSPMDGQDLRFWREGKGINTRYPAAKMRLMKPAPLHEEKKQRDEWMDYIKENPLPECLQYYDYDYISKVFNGHTKPKDNEDETVYKRTKGVDEDEESSASTRKSKNRTADKPPFDADDEGVDDEPRTRTRPRIVEDDEAENDEPEEKPRKGPKSSSDDEDESLSIKARLKNRRAAKETDDD